MTLDKFNNPFSNFRLGFHNGGGGSPLDVDLVAYYTLDEVSGDRIDCSPNGLDASIVGGTVGFTNDGIISGAADFTLSGGLISATDSVIDDIVGGSFTITTWVKLRSDTSGNVVSISNGGLNTNSLTSLFYDFNSKSFVGFVSDGVSGDFFGSNVGGSIPFDTWVFAVLKFDADTENYSLQLNNQTPAENNLGAQTSTIPSQKLAIGKSVDGGLPFDGCIDETSFYSRLLTDDEITHYRIGGGLKTNIVAAYFFESNPNDEGPNEINLGPSGGLGYATGVIDTAANFNGTFARLESSSSSALDALRENSFTVTFFGYVNSAHTGNGTMLNIMDSLALGEFLLLTEYNETNDRIETTIASNGGAVTTILSQQIGTGIPRDTFFSVQITFDASTLEFSLRLNQQAFTQTTLANTTDVNSGLRIRMGTYAGNADALAGRVDEATIYNEVLTEIDLNTVYMNGLATRPYRAGRAGCAPEVTDDFNNDFNNDFN